LKEDKIQWGQIIISAVLTAALSLIVSWTLYKWSQEKPELIYELNPPVKYSSETVKLTILSGNITNDGDKIAEGVDVAIVLPENIKLKDYQVIPSSPTIEWIALTSDSRKLKLSIPKGLNPRARISFSLITDGDSDKISVSASAKGIDGKDRNSTNKIKDMGILSFVNKYITIVVFVLYLIILYLLLDYIIPSILSSYAFKYFMSQRNQKAKLFYRLSVLLNERDARHHSYLSIVLSRLRDLDKAIIENLLALRLAPDDWVVLSNAAAISAISKEYDEAMDYVRRAVDVYDGPKKDIFEKFDNWREFKELSKLDVYSIFKSSFEIIDKKED